MVSASQDQIKEAVLRHAIKISERFKRPSQLYESSNNLKGMPWHPNSYGTLETVSYLEKICAYVI